MFNAKNLIELLVYKYLITAASVSEKAGIIVKWIFYNLVMFFVFCIRFI